MATNREEKKIAIVMSEALLDQQFVVVTVFNKTGYQQISGLITKIDQEMRKVKLSHERGVDWIHIDDIINLEIIVE